MPRSRTATSTPASSRFGTTYTFVDKGLGGTADSDSDQDGLDDVDEVDLFGSDPYDHDTDDDGLNDGEEVLQYGTSPVNPDTDGDGARDLVEVLAGTDPLDPTDFPDLGFPLPWTFDEPYVRYTFTTFGAGAFPAWLAADPIDPGNLALYLERQYPGSCFDGVVMATADDGRTVPPMEIDGTTTRIVADVWSERAGAPILLKVENGIDDSIHGATMANTTVAHRWETLTWDFTDPIPGSPEIDPAETYNLLALFPNFYCFDPNGATADEVFIFDNFAYAEP